MRKVAIALRTASLLALSAIFAAPALAGTVTLTGSGQMYWAGEYLGTSGGDTPTTPTGPYGNNYALSLPGQYTFQDQFTAPQGYTLSPSSPVGSYSFQDTYEFSLSAPAQGDALTVSLNLSGTPGSTLNIQNLQFRLYEVPSPAPAPGLNPPPGSIFITPWMGVSGNDNGTVIQANFNNVQSGTYFMDIAGTANGTSGGTYIGQLNLSPVPLPAGIWLLLSGLGGIGVLARKRR
jgi:hypothetical protein